MTETSLGIPPAQIAPFVAERLGITQSRRLMLTGARFKGAEAAGLGLVHFCEVNPDGMNARLEDVLDQIDRCAPGANAATKDIVLTSRRESLQDTLDMASRHFADCMLSDEGKEGVTAFLEKRKAGWLERGRRRSGLQSKKHHPKPSILRRHHMVKKFRRDHCAFAGGES